MVKDKVEETGVKEMVHKFYSADLHGFVHGFLQDLVNEMTEISAKDKLFLTIIERKKRRLLMVTASSHYHSGIQILPYQITSQWLKKI